jgi:hypothetical protein
MVHLVRANETPGEPPLVVCSEAEARSAVIPDPAGTLVSWYGPTDVQPGPIGSAPGFPQEWQSMNGTIQKRGPNDIQWRIIAQVGGVQ